MPAAAPAIKDLLEAGAHFGHQTRRWNPKMKPFIFIERNGIHIIDLQKTVACAQRAYGAVKAASERGEPVLFVGTKKQARSVVEEAAARCGQHFISERWLGGMLTNFQTVRKGIARYLELQKLATEGGMEQLSKKERSRLQKERTRLEKVLRGIARLDRLPGMLFVVDTTKEEIAVKEANRLGIPIVGIVDTNADPERIDYPIPGNDDAIRAIALFAEYIAAAVLEGRERSLEGREAGRLESGEDKTPAAPRRAGDVEADDDKSDTGAPSPRLAERS